MYRKCLLGLLCLAIMLIAVPSQALIDDAATELDSFQLTETTFSNSGANLKEIKLQVWGQISNRLDSFNQLDEKYRAAALILNLDPHYKAVQMEQDGFCSITHLEEKQEGTWQVSLQTVPINNEGESYLSILFTGSKIEESKKAYDKINRYLEKINSSLILGVTFCGQFSDFLPLTKRWNLANNLAQLAGAEFIEGTREDRITSLSFYSRRLSPFLMVNGRKINLNIALCYNNLESGVSLYVGSPLIYQDY